MVPTENILLLGSFYILTVQAQLKTNVECDKFPLNPLCSLSHISVGPNTLPISDISPVSLDTLETHRSLDLRPEQFNNARDQRYFTPINNPRNPNTRPNNFSPRPGNFNNHRLPMIQNSHNFRPPKRPSDSKVTSSNRKKRFFFWYSPADLLLAKKNLWKTKMQKLHKMKENVYQWKQPNANYLPYDEYDCVAGKLKPINSNLFGLNSNEVKNDGFINLHGQPVILASPLLMSEQYTSQNKHSKIRKKVKPVNYAIEMEQDNSEDSGETKVSYIRDHAPENIEDNSDSQESGSENIKNKNKINSDFEFSPNGERVEFQVQGHNGPKTYIFGFDTGDGKNRQYRLEERMKDGTVKGQYGYYDARGKLRTIKYIARPLEGYKEKHHEMNLSDLS